MVQDQLDFAGMAETERKTILETYNIALTPEEALKIQSLLQRPPTLAECILWGIQGSEHCSYKSSKIHLKTLTTQAPNVISGAKEDAGIIAIATDKQGHRYGLAISHESHNHPSQIVPFEGAATGIGGNIRDVTCMGATVIANADSLRFGDINSHKTQWLQRGVVSGIASYSNAIGVPNLAGDVYYDARYNDNCLVTVISLGILREDQIIHSYVPADAKDYDFILVGKPTDNSGFGGASFSSMDLNEADKQQNRGAVQEPNAFLGRMLMKSSYALFKKLHDKGLIDQVGFKDLGAGGIACASVELAEAAGMGADIYLDEVPVSMQNLNPSVILCAETQERYMWVAHPDVTPIILHHYNKTFALPEVSEGASAKVIGKLRADGRYHVSYQGKTIIDAKAHDITQGIVYDRPFQAPVRALQEPNLPEPDLQATLLALLASPNIASQKPIYENYDKQVQGRTVIERGQADAGVLQPFNSNEFPHEIQSVGVALAVASNPRFGQIDPYWTAVNSVVESMLAVTAVGATPQCLTDCLCFGNPGKPEQMWELVNTIRGLKAACEGIHLKEHPSAATPIVAGNVSLYNESPNGVIPASPMVSCAGKLHDIKHTTTPDFKQAGSLIVLVGERRNECGGSQYYALHEQLGANIPMPDFVKIEALIHGVHEAIQQGLVLSAKAINRGGLAVALARMCFTYRIGAELSVTTELPLVTWLFSETPGLLLEVKADQLSTLQKLLAAYRINGEVLGRTTEAAAITINDRINLSVSDAAQTWQEGLRSKLR